MWPHSGRASDRLVLAAAGLSIYSKSRRLSLLCSEQGFLSPNTKPNAVNIVCPEMLLFLTSGQALPPPPFLWKRFKAYSVLSYWLYYFTNIFLNSDQVKFFYRLAPARQPNQRAWESRLISGDGEQEHICRAGQAMIHTCWKSPRRQGRNTVAESTCPRTTLLFSTVSVIIIILLFSIYFVMHCPKPLEYINWFPDKVTRGLGEATFWQWNCYSKADLSFKTGLTTLKHTHS